MRSYYEYDAKNYTVKLRDYLHGSNKKPVEAAFILQHLSEYGTIHSYSHTAGYESACEKVGEISEGLLNKLRENEIPTLGEIGNLEKCIKDLENYGYRFDEDDGQRHRDYMAEHTDRNGNLCQSGP